MAYPYSKAETLADAAVHAAGLFFAIPASAMLANQAAAHSDTAFVATLIYAACLIVAFAASAVYHLCPVDQIRPLLHRIDHATIYFKIAGTYTPIVVVIGSGFAYGVLGVVWALAVIGAIAKLTFWRTDAKTSLALYLGMGWLSALLIWPMWQHTSGAVVAFVVCGGLIYSAGTRIYAHPGMRYQNAIWHSFVLLASICLFAAITLSI
ncbi:hemolysin III family protein [Sulfitobacter sp. F26204]|uniref:PAQR family membrane homeostasis protein TrhA n=1 Tax=Sulfitobacter sp. F26204 TaxID=2996014 RepID=UPI00225E5259|nr:hemolysin III family protein [Sulfitobacter sp. F26204]MCX7561075.1 hemolysin III family protein [Sulfitobacter sp. F26204]